VTVRHLLKVSFLAVSALSLAFLGSASAASSSSKRIAFVGGTTLWTAFPNGSGLTNLGRAGTNPSITTDGATIFFDDSTGVHSIPAAGGAVADVCPGGADPAVSPSGTEVAYEGAGGFIAVGSTTACGTTVASGSDPAWSPDGRQLAYTSGNDIFVSLKNGTGATNLTNSAALDSAPAWSSTGREIAYISDGELLVMNVDGSNKRVLTSNAVDESSPSWSADSAEIAFARDEGAATRLYAIQVSDGATRLIADGEQPDWGLAVANTSAPTIALDGGASTYAEGVQLSAGIGSWVSISPRSFSFRWQRCGTGACADIPGATAGTYKLESDDVGNTVRVVVVATTADGSAPGTSANTPIVAATLPRSVGRPTIDGDLILGETLTAQNGTWVGTNVVFTYQWQRCEPNGGSCINISGATAKTFSPASEDVGKWLRVIVTGANSLGTGTGTSDTLGPVASNVPANATLPSIVEVVGTIGATPSYRAEEGDWTGVEPMTKKFQWRRCDASGANCRDIAGATLASYIPVAADIGSTLRVAVTKTNTFGSTTAVSAATAVLAGSPPVNAVRPFVSGTERAGSVLTASTGTWTGSLPLTYTYQWQRCNASGSGCAAIAGSTSSSYVATPADVGATLAVQVTARNAAGSATVSSAPTDAIEAAAAGGGTAATRPANTRLPTITGTLARGKSLRATVGTWTGTTPMTYSYQWLRCPATGTACVAVHGSTTANYKLGTADVGKRIRLVVTAGNGAGSTAASSAITAIVKATAPAAVRAVNGNAKANRLTGTARAERIDGKGGNDRIDGRGGKDTLIGGTGNDTIMAADGIAETVSCGPGRDTAVVDRSDKVSGCEKVTRRAPKKATVKKKK
jgi:hypothetical protein